MPSSQMDSPESTHMPPPTLSMVRRIFLLMVFCLANFLDTFNTSAVLSAIPSLDAALKLSRSESAWLISAFQLTLSAFLLLSGKLCDVFSAKWTFIVGLVFIGTFTLIAGFMNDKIAMLVLRALTGIAGSMTIPSSLTLIVRIFPEPGLQGRAIGAFGASAALGNILGLLIGAVFTQLATWRWVFWFSTILAFPSAFFSVFSVPHQDVKGSNQSLAKRIHHMDLPGVVVLTAALILLILALTESTNSGWGSAIVIVPLVISIALLVVFFLYERWIPEQRAAVPPKTWLYKNFAVLFGVALLPYFWWMSMFIMYTNYWQEVYQYSVIMTAVRLIPSGIAAAVVTFSAPLTKWISVKKILLIGYVGMIIGSILLAFANSPGRYWSYVFPAFLLGSSGTMLTYVFANIGLFKSTPPEIAGVVGALFNGAIMMGSAVGTAVVASIQLSVESKSETGREGYDGLQAGFFFVMAMCVVAALGVLVFYDDSVGGDRFTSSKDKGSERSEPESEKKSQERIA